MKGFSPIVDVMPRSFILIIAVAAVGVSPAVSASATTKHKSVEFVWPHGIPYRTQAIALPGAIYDTQVRVSFGGRILNRLFGWTPLVAPACAARRNPLTLNRALYIMDTVVNRRTFRATTLVRITMVNGGPCAIVADTIPGRRYPSSRVTVTWTG
jgi:hypothetical protein